VSAIVELLTTHCDDRRAATKKNQKVQSLAQGGKFPLFLEVAEYYCDTVQCKLLFSTSRRKSLCVRQNNPVRPVQH